MITRVFRNPAQNSLRAAVRGPSVGSARNRRFDENNAIASQRALPTVTESIAIVLPLLDRRRGVLFANRFRPAARAAEWDVSASATCPMIASSGSDAYLCADQPSICMMTTVRFRTDTYVSVHRRLRSLHPAGRQLWAPATTRAEAVCHRRTSSVDWAPPGNQPPSPLMRCHANRLEDAPSSRCIRASA